MGMNFLRRDWNRHPKLGKKRKNKQVWRRPKGRDNKMREKRKGYPKVVSVGYEKEKSVKEKINGKYPLKINTISDLEILSKKGKDYIGIIGKMGKKKKTEILKKAQEKGIELANVNIKKFLKQAELEKQKKKEKKDKKKVQEQKDKKSEEKTKENKQKEKAEENKKSEENKQQTETKKQK